MTSHVRISAPANPRPEIVCWEWQSVNYITLREKPATGVRTGHDDLDQVVTRYFWPDKTTIPSHLSHHDQALASL